MMLSVAKSPFRSPEFLAEFKFWNEKLARSGFQDAEDFSLPEPALKSWHSFKWRESQARAVESKHYFELAHELLHTFAFRSALYRKVWELHCEGLSVRQIARRLRRRKLRKSQIHWVIRLIQMQSGIKP